MPLFLFKRRKAIADTERVAREQRASAELALAQIQRQQPQVDSIVKALGERRESNNFGDEVTLTFTPRKV